MNRQDLLEIRAELVEALCKERNQIAKTNLRGQVMAVSQMLSWGQDLVHSNIYPWDFSELKCALENYSPQSASLKP